MNSKLREQGKKEEKRRLKEFVENAYRCDPRIIAHKEAQRAERWGTPSSHRVKRLRGCLLQLTHEARRRDTLHCAAPHCHAERPAESDLSLMPVTV